MVDIKNNLRKGNDTVLCKLIIWMNIVIEAIFLSLSVDFIMVSYFFK